MKTEAIELNSLIKKAYSNFKTDVDLYLTTSRKIVEFMVKTIGETNLDETKRKEVLKNALEGQISYLYNKKLLPASISSHLHIVRICGNYGTHHQNETFDEALVEICHSSMKIVISWYFNDILHVEYNIDEKLSEINKDVFIVYDLEESRVAMKNLKKKKVRNSLFSIADTIVRNLVVFVVLFLIYYIVNKR